MEAFVGALGAAFSGEHSDWKFVLALEWEDAAGEREDSRNVFAANPLHLLAPIIRFG